MPDDDPTPHVRPATAAERADVRGMHAANRRAWDEAAERYEGWFAEAVELISSGGTNLLPPELELIGDLHGRCRRAIHLQCAGGRDTLSLWNLGADEVVGVDFSPRMLELAGRLSTAVGAPARWIEADVLDTPHELDGTADLVYTGRGSLMWLQDLDAWAAVARTASWRRAAGSSCSRATRPSGCSTSMPTAAGSRPTTTTSRARGVEGLGARVHRPALDRRRRPDTGSSPAPGRSARSSRPSSAPGSASSALAEHPTDWWNGHADVRADERGRIPLSFSVLARRDA